MKNTNEPGKLLKKKLSRRSALKSFGALGVAPFLLEEAAPKAAKDESVSSPFTGQIRRRFSEKPDLHRLSAGEMVVDFDKDTGTIHSITRNKDPFGTNFVGNRINSRSVTLNDMHWSGDVVATVWDLDTPDWIREQSPDSGAEFFRSGRWRRESTLESDDSRMISFDQNSFRVSYQDPSQNENGIRHFKLDMSYRFADDGSLLWDIEIANVSDRTLELGELAIPLRVNDDYAGPYDGMRPRNAVVEGKMPVFQKIIHEQKVFAHAFVAGHSSYVLIQRPRGDGPFLMFHCERDTPLECLYKVAGSSSRLGITTDLLAIHSWAAYRRRGWNPWVNGHTSLILEPGQKRSFRFRFVFIEAYPEIRDQLVNSGNLGIRILPSMVVQENTDVHVEVRCLSDLDDIEVHSDGVLLKERRRAGDAALLTLSFEGRGQKSLNLKYGGRWTYLHFYCVEDAELLIKARARFMARRQFYENPKDPYNRNHVFLPFDYQLGRIIDDYPDVWEVGGTGDPGFGDPLFLAEKNVFYPSREEIEKLEIYVDDCLFRHIQNPETYEIRASLYWKVRYPSSPSSSYSKERSEATWRTYSYAFVANIYHSLYRVGRRYGLLTKREPADYLRMAYRTCLKWFTTGPYRHAGLMTGSNAVEILADLKNEGWNQEHARLLALMRECNDEFIRDPYPYCSEIEIDETGQHQVYFFTKYFAGLGDRESREKNADVVRVLKALRGGDQPVWFGYGNDLFAHPDLRNQLSCWHSEVLNGLALLTHFEESVDPVALMKAYPGVMSVLRCVQPDGMGFAWFVYDPEVFGFEPPRTFEGGIALWGFLKAARAYVVEDRSFGLVGYGCRLETTASEIRVFPQDGVKKRVRFVSDRIDLDVLSGEITFVALNRMDGSISLRLYDSTGLVEKARLAVSGLQAGEYEVKLTDGASERHTVEDALILACPLDQAKAISIRKV